MSNWTYHQANGELWYEDKLVSYGYSGLGAKENNPGMQHVRGAGPIPQGVYQIGAPIDPPDRSGPLAMPLTHISGETFGRSGFFVQDASAWPSYAASEQGVTLLRAARVKMNASRPATLTVVP